MLFKCLIIAWLCVIPVLGNALDPPGPQGIVEGNLHIYSPKTVELADGSAPTVTAETYAEYPLVVLSQDGKKVITTVTADGKGQYRLALPPGSYVLDVQDRMRKHVRAKPQPFTVTADQTVHLDLDMDTGIR